MQEKCTIAQQSCLSRSKAVLVQKEQRDQQFRKVGHGNDSHGSVRLPIGRLSVRSTATEEISVALLGQEFSPQLPRQGANFRLRPATNCHHQKLNYKKIDQIKNKPQDLLVNTSSGNRVLFIAGYRPAQEFVIEQSLCTR